MKLLIDGDVIAYRAAFATEKTKYLVTDMNKVVAQFESAADMKPVQAKHPAALVWSRKEREDADKAVMIAHVMIADVRARYPGAETVVYVSGVGNFRHAIATRASYKGNRPEKPKNLKAVIEDLVESGAVVSAGEEADDLLGIAATTHKDSVVCSVDKDLMQLPGRHYNFVTKEEVTVSVKDAAINFYAQVLSGDATDNIPGVTGIGPVKAHKLLADCASPSACWARILEVYIDVYKEHGEAYAIEAARLVYVRRKAGEIWKPLDVPTAKTKALANKKDGGSRRVPQRTREVDSGRSESQGSSI